MATLTFLLGLFFANFNNTSVPVNAGSGQKFETKTSIGKDRADFVIGDDEIGRKP